eukprot:1175572-Prorocentrum_minimum.AAC.3
MPTNRVRSFSGVMSGEATTMSEPMPSDSSANCVLARAPRRVAMPARSLPRFSLMPPPETMNTRSPSSGHEVLACLFATGVHTSSRSRRFPSDIINTTFSTLTSPASAFTSLGVTKTCHNMLHNLQAVDSRRMRRVQEVWSAIC